ncbi:MAG: hypothetical protein U5R06_24085 [candidate division KSB1 bacterium]|nr:hypothetical protein [candidate division KSB1 bacterium]
MKTLRIVFLSVLIIFPVSRVRAQQDVFFWGQELGVGARAIGMGGAYTSVADDYSGVYWNPAGIGQMDRSEFHVGLNRNTIATKTDFFGNETSAEDGFTHLNSLGLVFPFPTVQGSFVMGFGFHQARTFDNHVNMEGYNESWAAFPDFFDMVAPDNEFTTVLDNVHQTESVTEKGGLNNYSLAASVEFQKELYFGTTIGLVQGTNEYSLRLEESDIYNLHNETFEDQDGNIIVGDLDYWTYNQSINSKFTGLEIKLGTLYRLNKLARIGAAVTLPRTLNITEEWSDEWEEVYDDGTTYTTPPETFESEYKIKEPLAFSMGGSLELPFVAKSKLLLAADMEYRDWSEAEFKTDAPLEGVTKSEVNNTIQNDLGSVVNLRLGGELYVPFIQGKLRGGYMYNPSPYKDVAVKPDKTYYTLGLSFLLDHQIKLDLGYVRGLWEVETYDGLTNTVAFEDKSLDQIIGTLSVRF